MLLSSLFTFRGAKNSHLKEIKRHCWEAQLCKGLQLSVSAKSSNNHVALAGLDDWIWERQCVVCACMLDGGEGVRHGVVAWRLPNRSVGCRHSMASITAALDLTTLVSLPTISIAAAVPVLTRVEHEQRLWLSGHEEKKKRRGRRGSTHKYTQTHRRTHTHTHTHTQTQTQTQTQAHSPLC